MITISVIIGSIREGRFSEKPARWILQHLQKLEGIEARLLDLRDFPMPFFDQPLPPAMPGRPPYEHEVVKRWTAAIGASDGFISSLPNTTTVRRRCSRTRSIGFIQSGTARLPPS
jgi:NAD(P)H-dependent FMN reductase